MPSVIRNNQIEEAPDSDVDVEIISPSRLVGTHANVVPLFNNTQSARLFYGARFENQAMPLKYREAPLVQSLDPEDEQGRSFESKYGKRLGARYFDTDDEGTVSKITPDDIEITLKDGTKKKVDLYNNFQFNRKTQITNTPQVKVGDVVKRGDLLASSNYTDDKGTMALGINARVALVPYKGYSMDDAIVISDSFAKRMTSEHSYESELAKDGEIRFGKTHYTSLFPRQFTKEQLENLDDSGMVKPGTILHKGDPIMLATRPRAVSSNTHLGKLGKTFRQMRSDAAEVWEHDYPGEVVDSVDGKKHARVFINASVPMQVGDKLIASRPGQKCYHRDTEVFTDRGWVKICELSPKDKVAALFNKHEARFVSPIAYTEYDYSGELYGLDTRYAAYLVTPNHRVWCCKPGGEFKIQEAQEIHRKRMVFMVGMALIENSSDEPEIATADESNYYKEHYTGKVYCCQVPGLGVILTRFRGKVMWNGNSIVAKIIPEEQMLRSLDGKPFEVLLNPLALPSRVNTATPYELQLGKLAAIEGKPINVAAFNKKGSSRLDEVLKELEKHGVSDTEEVFDPVTNRKLEKPVTTGISYMYKLHHVVESKLSARGQGSYDANEQPTKGGSESAQAKRMGGLETTALMAHGAYATLREGSTLRGQKNDNYWQLLRQGYRPPEPGRPFVWDKFRVLLNGAGYNAKDLGKGTLRLAPFTDKDLDSLNPLEVENGKLVNLSTLEPEKGGLFDPSIVAGNRWGKITLPHRLPNPAFEKQIQQLLGITNADMRKVISGQLTLDQARQNGK